MTIDMAQFHSVFFDESLEHLEEMEQTFLEISVSAPSDEQLNSIFRAAHSIKGGSGVFGFEALIGLTHVMESVLDKARKHKLELTPNYVDTLIKATDELRHTLDAYMGSSEPNWSSIEQHTKQVESILTGKPPESSDSDKQGYEIFKAPLDDADDAFGFFEPLPDSACDTNQQDEPKDKKTSKIDEQTIEHQVSVETANTQETVPSKGSGNLTTIRVDTGKIDELMNLVGEMVITQSMLFEISKTGQEQAADERLQGAVLELERNTRLIQESVMSMRMLPMSFVFNRFPRVVRDLTHKLNKKVELDISGAETEIDKGLTEKLVDPLTHLIRNSIDHGIEMPETRLKNGKPSQGRIRLSAAHKGGSILIKVSDDGAGLDREKIIEKAQESGIAVDESQPDHQIWPLIMKPGFSTALEVSDLSGRGVGMDVVKRNIESIGGVIEIHSVAGEGSTFNIRLPLTLAIVDGMTVRVGSETFIIPLVSIVESIRPSREQIKSVGNQQLLWLREKYWPIFSLHNYLGHTAKKVDVTEAVAVLIESNNKRFCLVVDALINQQQVVVKSLEQNFKKVDGVAGATILGDGQVALILDVDSLSNKVECPADIHEACHA